MKIIDQVKEVLNRFKEGYLKEDLDQLDSFMEDLFIDDDQLFILGTGDGELCLGYEESKELVEGDWKYWGLVQIDADNANIYTRDDIAWFEMDATVRYTFKSNESEYKRYLNIIKEDLEVEGKSTKEKLTQVGWVMTHAFFDREDKERVYDWPLKISGVLTREENQLKFAQMQFVVPKSGFPDGRYTSEDAYRKSYQKILNKFGKYQNSQQSDELKEVMAGFEKEWANPNQGDFGSFVEKYFALKESPYLIDPDNNCYREKDELIENLPQVCQHFENISFDSDKLLISSGEEVAWITTVGLNHKAIREEKLLNQELEKFIQIAEGEDNYKDRLFEIQKGISEALMETAKGEEFYWPFRFNAILIKENGNWKFHNIHLSYSYIWILEGKF